MLLNQQRLPIVIGKSGETKKLIEKLTRTRIEIDSKTGEVTIFPTEENKSAELSEGATAAKVKAYENMLQRAAAEVEAESKEKVQAVDAPIGKVQAVDAPIGKVQDHEPLMMAERDESLTLDGEELPQLENLGNLNVWIAENIIRAINRGFNPQKALRLLNEEYMLEIIDLEPILGRSEKAITRVKGRIIGENGSMRSAIEKFASSFISVFGNTIAIIGQFDDIRVARKSLQMLIQGVPHKNVYSFLEKKYKEKKDENIKKLWKPTF